MQCPPPLVQQALPPLAGLGRAPVEGSCGKKRRKVPSYHWEAPAAWGGPGTVQEKAPGRAAPHARNTGQLAVFHML